MTDYQTSPNPKRFYRSRHKVIAGVCAGIAERMGWDIMLTRVVIAILFFSGFFSGVIFIGYFVLWAITPTRRYERANLTPDEERFWAGVSDRPSETFSNIRYKFRDLDDRLAGMERTVTSDEWKLRREFRDLEGGAQQDTSRLRDAKKPAATSRASHTGEGPWLGSRDLIRGQ